MQLDLSGNFFELFGFSNDYIIDENLLTLRFRELQGQLHPDKFVSRSDSERRWSMQAASLVNEAYQTLGDDLKRAAYLLHLNGISVDEETDTKMDPMFLMDQMELRESLEMAETASDPFMAIAGIRGRLRTDISNLPVTTLGNQTRGVAANIRTRSITSPSPAQASCGY